MDKRVPMPSNMCTAIDGIKAFSFRFNISFYRVLLDRILVVYGVKIRLPDSSSTAYLTILGQNNILYSF